MGIVVFVSYSICENHKEVETRFLLFEKLVVFLHYKISKSMARVSGITRERSYNGEPLSITFNFSELEKYSKAAKVEYPIPSGISGKGYTLEEIDEMAYNKLSAHYGVDVRNL